MKSSAVRPLTGSGVDRRHRLDHRPGRRPVPGQLHQNRSGDRHFGSRRPGDEPRRQGEDARRAGRQGVVDRVETRRHGGDAPGDGSVAASSHSRPTSTSTSHRRRCSAPSSSTGAAGEPFAAETAPGSGDSEPARHGRDQHRLPATGTGAGQDRPRQAQPDPRRDRDGVQRPRREDRQDADRLQRVPGQDRTEPAEPEPRHRGRCSDAQRVRRCGARPRHRPSSSTTQTQQFHRRRATEPRRVPGQLNRFGRRRKRRDRRQPARR